MKGETNGLIKEYTALYESYDTLANKLADIARVTGFQAVIYDE